MSKIIVIEDGRKRLVDLAESTIKAIGDNPAISGNLAEIIGVDSVVSDYLTANPPTGGLTITQIKSDPDISDAIGKKHPAEDLSVYQLRESGKGLSSNDFTSEMRLEHDNAFEHSQSNHAPVNAVTLSNVKTDLDIASAISLKHSNANDHAPGSDNQDLSGLQPKETGKGLSANDLTTALKTSYDSAVTHAGSSHAPTNAQKNSDITDAEIKAKYVTPTYNSVYRTILDSTGSHIATKAAGTYGIPQGNPLAITGVGTLYALNTIYIAATDYPTIDGKVTKLRVRAIIECNDVAPFTGTFKVGLHPVTRPSTSGGAGVCIYTIGSPVTNSQATGTNLAADSQTAIVSADFDLPADGFYTLAVVTSATMATSSHVHISASLQIHNV
jgi:hypothetical protein